MRQPTPAATIASLAAEGERLLTPCGDGTMVWHRFGQGPAVILLHGGYGAWTHWVRNILTLARHHTLFVADLPGLGESATPPLPHDPDRSGAIVATALDLLVPPPGRYHMVGFSFGSVVGSRALLRQGERALSFVAVGAAGMGPERPPPLPLQRVLPDMNSEQAEAVVRENLAMLMFKRPERIDALALHIQQTNTARARFQSRRFAFSDLLKKALPEVRAPLHAIWGDSDSTAGPHLQDRIAFMRSVQPGADIRVIEDTGHWVQYEAAATFDAMLLDMLRGHAE